MLKKTISTFTILAFTAIALQSCGSKPEWESMADDYCGCIEKAQETKTSAPEKYVEEFKKCQDMTMEHRTKIKDANEIFDYGKKVGACVDAAYKK